MTTHEVTGFLKTSGTKLINGDGQEILLRGVGFGSWLLPEGYMWRFPKEGDRPRRIERMVEELIGEEKALRFWNQYYDRYVGEADVRQIAAEGFNSVRVPINARFLLEEDEPVRFRPERLRFIDRVIGWCRTYRLYVILDLHGAPGGQTGTNIDDSERDLPELFTDERNRNRTVELWRMLAERYKDEWIVAGYDLLNEPLPNWFSQYNSLVMPLYRDIVKAIREADDRHMIILEGVHWATDWSIFDEKPDDNCMLQFHKYWNNPDTESIRVYLDKREAWKVPIFMGEGGENNKDWYAGAFRLFEDHGISWNFWTWKKMDTDNSPCSVKKPAEWQRLVDYLEGGSKPDEAEAERILWEYLNHLPFDRCDYHPEVVRSLFRRPTIRIPAIYYGYEGEGVSFGINRLTERNIGFRINDGMELHFIEGERSVPNFQHTAGEPLRGDEQLCIQLNSGEWAAYKFRIDSVEKLPFFIIDMRLLAINGSGTIAVIVDDTTVDLIEIRGLFWETYRLDKKLRLDPGLHQIVLKCGNNQILVEWLEVKTQEV
ncbi:glycoside hydrolase [Gordoniibacillus kamchatkensis]|uniref:Glycoside hydrolase n=1 Tax=Gordoniibacillus kamchatkensis TaxID=1590651 RepID=A0ABR5AHB3_9BACL|nr:cellulase family glycosylhydrolase [Paenibacillus sp. VKM B-2647]KIL40441.1 glycoside hydrolase [Paenibacillus sp. VKM B-2647]